MEANTFFPKEAKMNGFMQLLRATRQSFRLYLDEDAMKVQKGESKRQDKQIQGRLDLRINLLFLVKATAGSVALGYQNIMLLQ